MKHLLSLVLLGMSGVAMAGDLEQADKLLQEKAYDKALPIYSQLAQSGNVEAQFRLGEMYWYGDGTAVDLAAANAWFQKAAQQGHKGAVESLDILKQRASRAADIAYWTSGQAAGKVVVSRYDCAAPELAAEPKSKQAIKDAANRYKAWQECYDRFAATLNAQVRAAPQIPADVLNLLTPREAELAFTRLNGEFTQAIAKAEREAMRVTGQYMAWQNGNQNGYLSATDVKNLNYQITRRRMEEREMAFYPRPGVSMPAGSPQPGTTAPAPGR